MHPFRSEQMRKLFNAVTIPACESRALSQFGILCLSASVSDYQHGRLLENFSIFLTIFYEA